MYKYLLILINNNISTEDIGPLEEYAFSVAVVCCMSLGCFFNVILYLIILNLAQKYDLEAKYPRARWLIKRFKQSTWATIIVELIFGTIGLILIAIVGFIPLWGEIYWLFYGYYPELSGWLFKDSTDITESINEDCK